TVGGLGLNSFIAPIYFWGQGLGTFGVYVLCGLVLPALFSVVGFKLMKKVGLVRDNELHLNIL
ncbi:MAG: PTS sugar transporter subunit IIC, partial [Ligilactobacillus agilis]|nr:PTS sugar transporter subunit IIC [Ligilactobacillus agilis]